MKTEMLEQFAQYLQSIDADVEAVLTQGNGRRLSRLADRFEDASLQPGHDLALQTDWLCRRLSDPRFRQSRKIYKFALAIYIYADLLDAHSRKKLAAAYLDAIQHLKGEADLVAAMEFLVRAQEADKALSTIEQHLMGFVDDKRLRPFVHDALSMYALRQDLSSDQLARARELSRSIF
jgi:hypothetical protein